MLDVMPGSSQLNCFLRTEREKKGRTERGGGTGWETRTQIATGGLKGFAAAFVRTDRARLSRELEYCVDTYTQLVFFSIQGSLDKFGSCRMSGSCKSCRRIEEADACLA